MNQLQERKILKLQQSRQVSKVRPVKIKPEKISYSPGHDKAKETRYTAKAFLTETHAWSVLNTNDPVLARLHVRDVQTGFVQDNLMRVTIEKKGMDMKRRGK